MSKFRLAPGVWTPPRATARSRRRRPVTAGGEALREDFLRSVSLAQHPKKTRGFLNSFVSNHCNEGAARRIRRASAGRRLCGEGVLLKVGVERRTLTQQCICKRISSVLQRRKHRNRIRATEKSASPRCLSSRQPTASARGRVQRRRCEFRAFATIPRSSASGASQVRPRRAVAVYVQTVGSTLRSL